MCSNTTGKNSKSIVLKTQGTGCLKDNIINVFGITIFNCLEPVNICLTDICNVDGYVSKAGSGSGRNLGDRQYFFVNGRPVDMPKVGKLVNELYKGANTRQYPIAILNFTIPTVAYDVNVTPDKRKIFFSDEGSILSALRESLQEIYSPSLVSYTIGTVDEDKIEESISITCSPSELPLLQGSKSQIEQFSLEEDVSDDSLVVKSSKTNYEKLLKEKQETRKDKEIIVNDFALRVHGNKHMDSFSGSDNLKNNNSMQSVADVGLLSPKHPEKESVKRGIYAQSSIANFIIGTKRKADSVTVLSESPILRNGSFHQQCKSPISTLDDSPKVVVESPENINGKISKHVRIDTRVDEVDSLSICSDGNAVASIKVLDFSIMTFLMCIYLVAAFIFEILINL